MWYCKDAPWACTHMNGSLFVRKQVIQQNTDAHTHTLCSPLAPGVKSSSARIRDLLWLWCILIFPVRQQSAFRGKCPKSTGLFLSPNLCVLHNNSYFHFLFTRYDSNHQLCPIHLFWKPELGNHHIEYMVNMYCLFQASKIKHWQCRSTKATKLGQEEPRSL